MTAPVALYDRNGNQIGELRNISTATEPDIGKWHISDASPHRVNCDRCHKRLDQAVQYPHEFLSELRAENVVHRMRPERRLHP